MIRRRAGFPPLLPTLVWTWFWKLALLSPLAVTDVAAAAERLEFAAKAEDFTALFTHLDALEEALQQYVAVVDTLEGL